MLVSIDTLRADRLPLHGYAAGRTPELDALALRSVVFENAISHYPLTLPSHVSLFTGLLPPRHGVRNNSGFRLDDAHETLAERLAAGGWKTGAAVSSFVLAHATGIGQGFDYYDDMLLSRAPETFNAPQRDGQRTLTSLLRWIDARGDERFFAFLHLYEPHSPYAPPPEFADFEDPYDGEVAYADALLGGLLTALEQRGLLERSIVVVTSDHGEDLGDHGEQEHGILLRGATLHVPLLIHLPGDAYGGRRLQGVVGLADLVPTLLDLVGLANDAQGLDGQSLAPAIASGEVPARRIYSETLYPRYTFGWSELRAVSDGRWRFVRAPRPELYDLEADPGERVDLSSRRGATARKLDAWITSTLSTLGDEAPPTPAQVSAEEAERLRQLGYLAPSGAALGRQELPDPKDKVSAYPMLKQATTALRSGRADAAAPLLAALVADNPDMPGAREMLADALLQLGRRREAIRALEEGLAREPDRRSMHLALARALLGEGEVDAALRHAQAVVEGKPGGAAELLSRLYLQRSDLDAAARWARRSLAQDDGGAFATLTLAVTEKRAGRLEEALALLERADDLRDPGVILPGLHLHRGDCLAELGRLQEAVAAYRAELQVRPLAPGPRVGLAKLHRLFEREDVARHLVDAWLLEVPVVDAQAYATLIWMHGAAHDAASAEQWRRIAAEAYPADERFQPATASRHD